MLKFVPPPVPPQQVSDSIRVQPATPRMGTCSLCAHLLHPTGFLETRCFVVAEASRGHEVCPCAAAAAGLAAQRQRRAYHVRPPYKLPFSLAPFLAKDKCEICESHMRNVVHGGIGMIWMTTFMLEICPALLHLVCPDCSSDMAAICDAAADWLFIDIDNHVVPYGIYYCEKMGLSPPAHPNPPPPAAASARSLPPPSRPPLPCFCQAFAPSRPIPLASPSSTTSRCLPHLPAPFALLRPPPHRVACSRALFRLFKTSRPASLSTCTSTAPSLPPCPPAKSCFTCPTPCPPPTRRKTTCPSTLTL